MTAPEGEEVADLFFLLPRRTLCLLTLPPLVEHLSWARPRLLWVRLHLADPEADPEAEVGVGRAVLTADAGLAKDWNIGADAEHPWRWLRSQTRRSQRSTARAKARVFDSGDPTQATRCLEKLAEAWRRPDHTLQVRRLGRGIAAAPDASVDPSAKLTPPLWIGAGCEVAAGASEGPGVLYDQTPGHAESAEPPPPADEGSDA